MSSALTRRQDPSAFLSVLYRAVQGYGPPGAFITDSGSIFLANRAQAIYRALGIRKLEIERGQPWQSYLETGRNVQRRMADYYFANAAEWAGLLEEHDRWMHDYNIQGHCAYPPEFSPGSRRRVFERRTWRGRSSWPATRVP